MVAFSLLALMWAGNPLLAQMTSRAPLSEARQAEINKMQKLGRKYTSAWSLYSALKDKARGGQRLQWSSMSDWSGVYSRDMSKGITFNQEQQGELPDIKLTPKFHKQLVDKVENYKSGIEYDPISGCSPPGHPRWLTSPFLREQIVTPEQTWLVSEVTNSTRRIYTDGRAHPSDAERYPLYNGDSIGFWDDDRLVVHTRDLMSGQYTRSQPDYTNQIETVEIIWVADSALYVDSWTYDPPALLEPWYVRHVYSRLDDPDKQLRIRYWYCAENSNNAVYETEEGTSKFADFDFDSEPTEQPAKAKGEDK